MQPFALAGSVAITMASASAVRLRIAFMKNSVAMPFQSRVRGIGSWSSTVHGPNRNSAGSLAMFGDDVPGRNHLGI
jgi:hypothetical protein